MRNHFVGQQVTALSAIDYEPYAVIAPGETGKVVGLYLVEGWETVNVQWDRTHPRLRPIGDLQNVTTLCEPESNALAPISQVREGLIPLLELVT